MDALSADEVATFDRIVVLEGRAGRLLLRAVENAGLESLVPVARHAALTRGRPSLVYYEHGEPLERASVRGGGDAERFLAQVDSLQEQWRLRNGRLQIDRFG